MSDQRVQVNNLQDEEQIRPSASPTDIYHRPAEQQIAKPGIQAKWAADLAEGLEMLRPAAERAANQKFKQMTEAEIKAGQTARAANSEKFRDLIHSGQIPEGMSPWFAKGVRMQEGRAKASEYKAALGDAMQKAGLYDSDDSRAVSAFVEKFRGEWMSQNPASRDFDVQETLAPGMHAAENNLSEHHLAVRQAEMSKRSRDYAYSEFVGLTRDAGDQQPLKPSDPGYYVQENADPLVKRKQKAAEIGARARELYNIGIPGREVNELAADAVFAVAIEREDASLLNMLDDIDAGQGSKLGSIKSVREKRISVENTIRRQLEHKITFEEGRERYRVWKEIDLPHTMQMREVQKKELERREKNLIKGDRVDDLTSELFLHALANPTKDLFNDPRFQELGKLEPSKAQWVMSAQRQYRQDGAVRVDDANAVNEMMKRIADDPSKVTDQEIFSGVPNRTWGVSTTSSLFSFKRQMQGADEKDAKFMRDPIWLSMKSGVVQAIRGSELNFDPAKSAIATQKQIELMTLALAWREKNPGNDTDTLARFRKDMQVEFERITKPYTDADAARMQMRDEAPSAPSPSSGRGPAAAPTATAPTAKPAERPKVTELTPEMGKNLAPGTTAINKKDGKRYQWTGASWVQVQK